MQAKLTYFRPSGKYYAEETVILPGDWFGLVQNVRELWQPGHLPGLNYNPGGHRYYAVLIQPIPEDVPHLIPSDGEEG